MIAWMHLLVSLLGAGILITLGLTKARPISPSAGWLFVGGGAGVMLSACCSTAGVLAGDMAPDPMIAMQLTTIVGSSADFIAVAIVAGAFVVLARAIRSV